MEGPRLQGMRGVREGRSGCAKLSSAERQDSGQILVCAGHYQGLLGIAITGEVGESVDAPRGTSKPWHRPRLS